MQRSAIGSWRRESSRGQGWWELAVGRVSAVWLIVALGLLTSNGGLLAAPVLEFDNRADSFGEAYQGSVVEHRFVLRNTGDADLEILSVVAASGAEATAIPSRLAPGAQGEIQVLENVGERLGRLSFRYELNTNDPDNEVRKLALEGFVQSAFQPERAGVDLGLVDRARGAQATVVLSSREVASLEILESLEVPEAFQVDWAKVEEGIEVRVSVQEGAPLGLHNGSFALRTNVPNQPLVRVGYQARVLGDVIPSEIPVDLQLMRAGQVSQKEILLRSRSGSVVAVESVSASDPAVDGSAVPCGEEQPGCLRLSVRVLPETVGVFNETLSVAFAGREEVLELPLRAVVAGPQTEVRDLPLGDLAQQAPSVQPETPEQKQATVEAPELRNVPTDHEGPIARLRWRSRTEDHVYGYLIYRAEQRSGPFLRINDRVLRVPDGKAPSHRYTFVDGKVEAGKTYYYLLDTLAEDGTKHSYSGVLSKTIPAQPPQEEGTSSDG